MQRGVEKGFCLFWWNLSNRRKFIRTLWGVPLLLLFAAWMTSLVADFSPIVTAILVLFVLVGSAIQAAYYYRLWKREPVKIDEFLD